MERASQKKKIAELEEENEKYWYKVTDWKDEVDSCNSEIDELKENVSRLEGLLNEKTRENEDLKMELKETKTELEK